MTYKQFEKLRQLLGIAQRLHSLDIATYQGVPMPTAKQKEQALERINHDGPLIEQTKFIIDNLEYAARAHDEAIAALTAIHKDLPLTIVKDALLHNHALITAGVQGPEPEPEPPIYQKSSS